AGPAEAAYCVARPVAIAEEVVAGSLAGALAVQASSAEFPADDYFLALPAELPEDGYFRDALAAPADDCSPVASQGTDEAAARAQRQMADGEHCDCWVKERCDFPARLDDHCPRERCEFPEEQGGYQELRAEEHSDWDGREHYYLGRHCSGRHCLDRHCLAQHYSDQHCSDRRGAEHSGFLERRGVGCCLADPDDSRGHCSA